MTTKGSDNDPNCITDSTATMIWNNRSDGDSDSCFQSIHSPLSSILANDSSFQETVRKRRKRRNKHFVTASYMSSTLFFLIAVLFGSSSLLITKVESFLQQQRLSHNYHHMSPPKTHLMNHLFTKQAFARRNNRWLLHSIQGISLTSSQLFMSTNAPKKTCLNTISSSSSNLVSGTTVDVTTPLPVFQSSTAISKTDHPNLQQQHQHSPTKKQLFHSKASVLSRPSSSDATLEVKDKRKLAPKKYWEKAFSMDLPEGRCVGLRLVQLPPSDPNSMNPEQIRSNADHWLRQYLHPKEIEYGLEKLRSEAARNTFFIGRLAMRTALKELDTQKTNTNDIDYDDLPKLSNTDAAILKDEYGRPTVPQNFLGSISHKQTTGVALVSFSNSTTDIILEHKASPRLGIGVDIEQTLSRRRSIAKKVLTENELNDLGKIEVCVSYLLQIKKLFCVLLNIPFIVLYTNFCVFMGHFLIAPFTIRG